MATLEKIRSKSVLLVSIIFVALFLFIITIIDNPLSIFMDNSTVVNVNGQKVNIEEYQKRAQEIREQNPQNENAESQAMQYLISETLMNQELDKLGIVVTPNEINEALVGDNAVPYFVNYCMQQFGATPVDVLSIIHDPASYNISDEQALQLSNAYKDFEDQVESGLKAQKFYSLLSGTINANKLDARAAFDEANTSYTIAAVGKNIYTERDSVTDAEIQKYYEEHKAAFKQSEPMRYVRYVDLAITPSNSDRQAAVNAVQQAMALLAESDAEGLEALQGDGSFVIDRVSGDETAIRNRRLGSLSTFVKEGNIGESRVVLSGAFNESQPRIVIARLIDRETKANGATVKQAVIDPAQNPDSVLARINENPEKVAEINGVLDVQESKFDFTQIPDQIVNYLREADGKYINLHMNNGAVVATAVVKYDEPKEIYNVQLATYNIEPSRETINALNTRMRDFMIVASRADAFNQENAAQQGLYVYDALVGNSSTGINNLSDTRSIVGWAMEDAKKGEVSRLFTDNKNTHMTVAALVDIYNGDYTPASYPQLRMELERMALEQKLADKIINDVQGKGSSLADYQSALQAASIDTLRNINVGNARYAQLGGIRGAKKGDLVGPVNVNGSVMVYEVLDAQEGEMPFDETANGAQYKRSMEQFLLGNQDALLLGDGKIKNRLLKFNR